MKPKTFTLLTLSIFLIFLTLSSALSVFGPPQIPLWYSLSVPDQQLEQKIAIFLFPAMMGTFSLFNLAFAKKTGAIDTSLQSLFLTASVIPLCILGLACIHILILVL